MSLWASKWAWEKQVQLAGTKLVLLALANFADDEGVCYPGQERIADMTNMSIRSVRNQIGALEAAGLITRTTRWRADGTRNSDCYQLMGQPADFAPSRPPNRQTEVSTTGKVRHSLPADFAGDPVRSDPSVDPSDLVVANKLSVKPKSKKPTLSLIPDDFLLTEADIKFARDRIPRLDPGAIFERFQAHHRAKGTQMLDWHAAWRTWVLKTVEFAAEKSVVNDTSDGYRTDENGQQWHPDGTPRFPPGILTEEQRRFRQECIDKRDRARGWKVA